MVKKKAEKQKKKAVVVSIDVTESKRKPVALHKAFLDALGKKYIEKKDKGFYTISDEKDKKVAFVRDANNTYLSVASRHFGDSKARQVRTEEAIVLAKQIGEN